MLFDMRKGNLSLEVGISCLLVRCSRSSHGYAAAVPHSLHVVHDQSAIVIIVIVVSLHFLRDLV